MTLPITEAPECKLQPQSHADFLSRPCSATQNKPIFNKECCSEIMLYFPKHKKLETYHISSPHNADRSLLSFQSSQGIKRTNKIKGWKEKIPLHKDRNPEQRNAKGLHVGDLEPETLHHNVMWDPQCPWKRYHLAEDGCSGWNLGQVNSLVKREKIKDTAKSSAYS